MCTTEHRDAIRSAFGDKTPLLWAGDPAQLPPVIDEEDKKSGVQPVLDFLEPTATLTTQYQAGHRFYSAGLPGAPAIRGGTFP